MSARVRFSDGEEPEAQLELEPELANRLFQALLCSVADPDLGSDAFLTPPGSGIRDG